MIQKKKSKKKMIHKPDIYIGKKLMEISCPGPNQNDTMKPLASTRIMSLIKETRNPHTR